MQTYCKIQHFALHLLHINSQKKFNMRQSTISLRVDDTLKKSFDELCSEFGFSSSAALTIFMKAVVRERRIPFEIKAGPEAENRTRAMAAFERMRAEAINQTPEGMSLDEINAIIREVRDAK